MKIMSLNVNQFAALRLDAGCWAQEIMTYIKGFLDGGKDNVVFLQEMPTDYSNRTMWAPVGQDFVNHFPGDIYQIFKPGAQKRANFYTIAIANANGGWSDQVGETRFQPKHGEKWAWVNRSMELIGPDGLRVLGLHAPMREMEFFEELSEYAAGRAQEKTVILGDMNVHSKKSGEYYKKFHSIRTEMGYTDLVEDGQITYFPNGNTLDHVLVSPALMAQTVVTAKVYSQKELELSDHAVIIVDVDL